MRNWRRRRMGATGVQARDDAVDHRALRLSLGEGSGARADAGEPAEVARPEAVLLDDAATERLLARLPAPKVPAATPDDGFAIRQATLPRPRPGNTVPEPFPPAGEASGQTRPEPQAPPPLRILRQQPVGEVPLAAGVSITFSSPMVPLDSVDAAVSADPPAQLVPQPPGQWRWADTRTLVFVPTAERMPMATEYTVTVAKGTRALDGGELARAEHWTFGTPAPAVIAKYPEGGPVRCATPIAVAFDQAVDAAAVIARLQVSGARLLREATSEERAADPAVARLVAEHPAERVVVVVPDPAPAMNKHVSVDLLAGTPSAEGPRTTAHAQRWAYRTPGPFTVSGFRAGWGRGFAYPGAPWTIECSNQIDAGTLDAHLVQIEPPISDVSVSCWGSTLQVAVPHSRGRSTYHLTLTPGLRDVFGQELEPAPAMMFKVGEPEPQFQILGGEHIVLDPVGPRSVTVRAIGTRTLGAALYRVTPADWDAWTTWSNNQWSEPAAPPPGRPVVRRDLETPGDGLAWADVDLDLGAALNGGVGQAALVVTHGLGRGHRSERQWTWVQATQLGLDASSDDNSLAAWVTDLATGAPLGGIALEVGESRAVSAADGTAKLRLKGDAAKSALVARRGADVAMLRPGNWYSSWQPTNMANTVQIMAFNDRGLYRPGETVRVKGWIRVIGGGPLGDLTAAPQGVTLVAWTARDAMGNEIVAGAASLDRLGGFDVGFALPPTAGLGVAALELKPRHAGSRGSTVHQFKIAEFRRPEYEVTASVDPGPAIAGDPVAVSVAAAYYAGGPLAGADVTWEVTAKAGAYSPPGWDRFTFGEFVPWWGRGWGGDEDHDEAEDNDGSFSGRTGSDGIHRLQIGTSPASPPRPWVVSAEGTVTDVNRQAWTASAAVVVHPAAVYVGLRGERSFVAAGEPLEFEAVVTDIDGIAMPGTAIALRAERREHRQVKGEWREEAVEVEELSATSEGVPVALRLEKPAGGRWRVTASIADDAGRANTATLTAWVAGGKPQPRRGLDEDELVLVPDKRTYAPGDVAEVLLIAPFVPAEGLLTLRRDGLLREERFTVESGTHTLRIPIADAMTPNIHASVALVGAVPRDGAPGVMRPAFASGTVELPVPPLRRTLTVAVTPRQTGLRPGESTEVDLIVRGAGGEPVSGGATVVVADEAVLALAGYANPDPLAVFYPERDEGVMDRRSRADVLLARPGDIALPEPPRPRVRAVLSEMAMPAPMAMAGAPMMDEAPGGRAMYKRAMRGGPEPAPEPIRARTDFSALALFAAAVELDADGRATVPLKLPDNLTRYRVVVVATDGVTRFGVGEAAVTARLPLMVRPSAPRFLNFGDTFELPVVIQNQTPAALEVDVAVRPTNARLTAGAGRRLIVPANDRAEVRFPAAADGVGEARFEVAAAAGPDADAATVTLPVWTPATTEAFAVHGTLDEGVMAQQVRAPDGAVAAFGGLEVTTSSTAVAALADAVLYLVRYPYECAEQIASRILGIAALRDVLAAFAADGLPAPAELEASVAKDLERLRAMQNADGGFGFWTRGDESWPYLTVHVANAAARAQAKGFDVPAALRSDALGYLRDIELRMDALRPHYPDEARSTISAYALDVRARLDDRDPKKAQMVFAQYGTKGLSMEALGWLLPVLDGGSARDEIRRHLANSVTETPGAANFTVSYGDGAHLLLASNRRADAVLLEALIADQPKSDLIPKLVAGLMAHRTAGRWGNTQENAFVLLALGTYFERFEGVTPDFVARLWLGEGFAGEQAFRGRSTDRRRMLVPMANLRADGGQHELLLAKDGPGRLYYRLGLSYAPERLALDALDRGFEVGRTYEGLDNPADVRRDPDGTWHVRAGARVRVTVTMTARSRRYHVALVDPMPAGFEAIDTSLAMTASSAAASGTKVATVGASGLGGPGGGFGGGFGHWWLSLGRWYNHQNLRDERVEAFTSLLWEGTYDYRYVARATTPGVFNVPPPKAEEMYTPETFGRGASDRVVVE